MAREGLRVAVLCPGFGRVMRGVETFTGELSRRLVDSRPDWHVDIFCRGPNAELSPGVRQIHIPAIDRDSRIATLYAQVGHRLGVFLRTRIDAECLSFAIALTLKFMQSKYDLIFNQAGPFAGRLLQVKRKMYGTPFMHKTASGYGDLELIMAKQRPDAIVATSPYAEGWLNRNCPGISVECIPNAVDRVVFRPYSIHELEAARDGIAVFNMKRPIVLFVGAMDPMKRPDLLISAVAKLPGVSLVMVGNGRLAHPVVERGMAKLGDRFLHVPSVSREQMAIYYNACDVFTMPSEEPFGIAFLEALACNKPVLAHSSPVQEWMFGDAGTTCDCTDADEYSTAIRRALETDFDSRPLDRSKEFDWSGILPRYEDLFVRVASSRRRR